ncbi:UNVERIFIED_CONTAM: putative protease [Acetivibrio alkalicellulosi]
MLKDKNVELLSPCGHWESFLAAVENGADAVYLGGKDFSARQFASNFDNEILKQAIKYAHLRSVNVYLTMNTLISDDELKSALNFLNEAYCLGIDGVIVQDIGLAKEISRFFPNLPLHGSTQMTIYNLEGVKALEEMGFKRVVLARELTLEEINYITVNTSIETEVFVHGALCISYSGQCLLSSIIGGRSGNRGKCAQPCRLLYQLGNKKSYYLSPKDLCTINILDEIVNTGVKSLKIEGRMKGAEYVAVVVKIYRKYLNKVLNGEKVTVEEEDIKDLERVFNRGGFTQGYFKGKTGREMMSFEKPKNWGTNLGKVISYDKSCKSIRLKLEDQLSIGDGIEVWNKDDESPGTIVTSIKVGDKDIKEAQPSNTVLVGSIRGNFSKGDKVYKTSNKKLMINARQTFTGKFNRKILIKGSIIIKHGIRALFSVKDDIGNEFKVESKESPAKAQNSPLTKERVMQQISKTGATPFKFESINIDLDNDISLPISEINNMRREALSALEQHREKKYNRVLVDSGALLLPYLNERSLREKKRILISVCFYKEPLSKESYNFYCDRMYLPFKMFIEGKNYRIIDEIKKRGTKVYISIPSITRGNYDRLLKIHLKALVESGIDGIVAGNMGTIDFASSIGDINIMGDYTLNAFNSSTIIALHQAGLEGVMVSPELNLTKINKLIEISGFYKEAQIYGRIPVMTSEYCPSKELNPCNGSCKGDFYSIKDRKNINFPIISDNIDCRSTIFNSKVLLFSENTDKIKTSGIDMVRLSFTDEEPEDIKKIVEMHKVLVNDESYIQSEYEGIIEKIKEKGFTKGHFHRGV